MKMSLNGAKLISLKENSESGESIEAFGRSFKIGYYLNCNFVLKNPKAKGVHCEINCDAFGRVTIRNHCQENPVKVNGSNIKVKRPLLNGSRITVLDQEFLWSFEKTKGCSSQDDNEPTTPKNTNARQAEQAPNSCPNLIPHKDSRSRLTIHSFGYSIKSDEVGNKCEEKNMDEQNENIEEINETINEASDKENEMIDDNSLMLNQNENDNEIELNNKFLSKFNRSDILITSFSPRETGVKIEKSFTALMKPSSITKSKTPLRTPRKILSEIHDVDFIQFSTPSSSKSPAMKNSSMHLLDLTTPTKLTPTSKSANKSTSIGGKMMTRPTLMKQSNFQMVKEENLINITQNDDSIISVASNDSNVIEISENESSLSKQNSPMKTPLKKILSTTPKRTTPQSLRMRTLILSAKKQLNTPKRLEVIPQSPSNVDEVEENLPNLSPKTPRRRVAGQLQFDVTSPALKSNKITDRNQFNEIITSPKIAAASTINAKTKCNNNNKSVKLPETLLPCTASTSSGIAAMAKITQNPKPLGAPPLSAIIKPSLSANILKDFHSTNVPSSKLLDDKSKVLPKFYSPIKKRNQMLVVSKISPVSVAKDIDFNSKNTNNVDTVCEAGFEKIVSPWDDGENSLGTVSLKSPRIEKNITGSNITFSPIKENIPLSADDEMRPPLNVTFSPPNEMNATFSPMKDSHNSHTECFENNEKDATFTLDNDKTSLESAEIITPKIHENDEPKTIELQNENQSPLKELVRSPKIKDDSVIQSEKMPRDDEGQNEIFENLLTEKELKSILKTPRGIDFRIESPSQSSGSKIPTSVQKTPSFRKLRQLKMQRKVTDNIVKEPEVRPPIDSSTPHVKKASNPEAENFQLTTEGDNVEEAEEDLNQLDDTNLGNISNTVSLANQKSPVLNDEELLEIAIVLSPEKVFDKLAGKPEIKHTYTRKTDTSSKKNNYVENMKSDISTSLSIPKSDVQNWIDSLDNPEPIENLPLPEGENLKLTVELNELSMNISNFQNDNTSVLSSSSDPLALTHHNEVSSKAKSNENLRPPSPADSELSGLQLLDESYVSAISEAFLMSELSVDDGGKEPKSMHDGDFVELSSDELTDERISLDNSFKKIDEHSKRSDEVGKTPQTPDSVRRNYEIQKSPSTLRNQQKVEHNFYEAEVKEKMELEQAFENFENEPKLQEVQRKFKTPQPLKAQLRVSRMTLENPHQIDSNFDLRQEKENLEFEKAFENFQNEPKLKEVERKVKTPEPPKSQLKIARMTFGNQQQVGEHHFDAKKEKEKLELERLFENFASEPPAIKEICRKVKTPVSVKSQLKISRMTLGNRHHVDSNFDLAQEKEKLEFDRAFENFEENPALKEERRKVKTPEPMKPEMKISRMTLGNQQKADGNFNIAQEKENLEFERAFENFQNEPKLREVERKVKTPEPLKSQANIQRMTLGNQQMISNCFDVAQEKEKLEFERAFMNFESEPNFKDVCRNVKTPEPMKPQMKISRMTLGNQQVIADDFDVILEKEKLELDRAFENFDNKPAIKERKAKTPDWRKPQLKLIRMTLGNDQKVDETFDVAKEKEKLKSKPVVEKSQNAISMGQINDDSELGSNEKELEVIPEKMSQKRVRKNTKTEEKSTVASTRITRRRGQAMATSGESENQQPENDTIIPTITLPTSETNAKRKVRKVTIDEKESIRNVATARAISKESNSKEDLNSKKDPISDEKSTTPALKRRGRKITTDENEPFDEASIRITRRGGMCAPKADDDTKSVDVTAVVKRRGRKMTTDEKESLEEVPTVERVTRRGRKATHKIEEMTAHQDSIVTENVENASDAEFTTPSVLDSTRKGRKRVEELKETEKIVPNENVPAPKSVPKRRGRKLTTDEKETLEVPAVVKAAAARKGRKVASKLNDATSHEDSLLEEKNQNDLDESSASSMPVSVRRGRKRKEDKEEEKTVTTPTVRRGQKELVSNENVSASKSVPQRRGGKLTTDEKEVSTITRATRKGRTAATEVADNAPHENLMSADRSFTVPVPTTGSRQVEIEENEKVDPSTTDRIARKGRRAAVASSNDEISSKTNADTSVQVSKRNKNQTKKTNSGEEEIEEFAIQLENKKNKNVKRTSENEVEVEAEKDATSDSNKNESENQNSSNAVVADVEKSQTKKTLSNRKGRGQIKRPESVLATIEDERTSVNSEMPDESWQMSSKIFETSTPVRKQQEKIPVGRKRQIKAATKKPKNDEDDKEPISVAGQNSPQRKTRRKATKMEEQEDDEKDAGIQDSNDVDSTNVTTSTTNRKLRGRPKKQKADATEVEQQSGPQSTNDNENDSISVEQKRPKRAIRKR